MYLRLFHYPQQSSNNRGGINKNWNQHNQNQQNQHRQGTSSNIPKPVQSLPPPPQKDTSTPMSQEEIEFDEQFRKWQEEFDNWKRANVNHPDKDAYRMYEQQFESVRLKLLQVRKVLILMTIRS
jgi:YLP motif-containing protein 1